MNKNIRLTAVFLLAFCSLFISSCDGNGNNWKNGSSNFKSFTYNLQGTWKTNEPSDIYSGTLVIDYNTIIISGYVRDELHELINGEDRRPFKDFTKNVALEGYSEEEKIFIKDIGVIQEGIPYTYWYTQPDNKQIDFLSFNFGGRVETLRKQ